jgi:LPXTG-motif cell wall-anchored protein
VAELPHTASVLPLIALFGILALGAFAVLGIRSKRMFIG